MYSAAKFSRTPRPNVYAIKTVCDMANSNKKDDLQKYAAFMSAKVLEVAIERNPRLMLGEG